MDKEIVEHKVEIDEYMTAILKIPKVLTALELKALMFKANKLFNLAEVNMVDKPKLKRVRLSKLTDKEMKDFIAKWDTGDKEKREEVQKALEVETLHKTGKHIYYLRRRLKQGLGVKK